MIFIIICVYIYNIELPEQWFYKYVSLLNKIWSIFVSSVCIYIYIYIYSHAKKDMLTLQFTFQKYLIKFNFIVVFFSQLGEFFHVPIWINFLIFASFVVFCQILFWWMNLFSILFRRFIIIQELFGQLNSCLDNVSTGAFSDLLMHFWIKTLLVLVSFFQTNMVSKNFLDIKNTCEFIYDYI